MAIQQLENGEPCTFQEHGQEQDPSLLLEALYCEEEDWEEAEPEEAYETIKNTSLSSLFLLPQDLSWGDEELVSLLTKEQEQQQETDLIRDVSVSSRRAAAVAWILKVNSHYGFTALTAILAINYVDRFLCSYHFQRDKPWMIQLAAVTCLSLAAKVEETQVPLLLDLQVEETRYVFEAKTIQRMELLILSTLQWKMHPITPISFLDHIIRRLGLKNNLHWDFLKRCERLLISLASDSRFVGFLPSVLAAATMMKVIEQVEPFSLIDYQNQLLGVFKFSREKVNDCYNLILELSTDQIKGENKSRSNRKRKNCYESTPSSPSCVIDSELFSSESSNDSSAASNCFSQCSSSPEPPLKKIRGAQEDKPMIRLSLSLNRAIVATP